MLNQSSEIASDLEINENLLIKEDETTPIEQDKLPKKMYVDIKGMVNNPGVYEKGLDDRVIDIINKAGGLLKEADTSNINLACLLEDEDVIIIPSKEEQVSNLQNDAQIKEEDIVIDNKNDDIVSSENEIVDLNIASLEDLTKVPGIGEKKAQDIINYRLEHGSFKTVEELKEISGIGDATFEKIKSYFKV